MIVIQPCLYQKTTDGRVLFFIPWYNKVIIGTTDTKVDSVLDDPIPLKSEIDLVINNANKYLTKPISKEDISSVYAGIRPLIKAQGFTGKIPREERINISKSGLISIVGGKWTTYRLMAERAIDFAVSQGKLKYRSCNTKSLNIFGYADQEYLDKIPFEYRSYGSSFDSLSKLASFGKKLHEDLPICEAQVLWSIREEKAFTIDDILARRTRCLFINSKACLEIADKVATIMQEELGFDEQWKNKEINNFSEIAQKYVILNYLN